MDRERYISVENRQFINDLKNAESVERRIELLFEFVTKRFSLQILFLCRKYVKAIPEDVVDSNPMLCNLLSSIAVLEGDIATGWYYLNKIPKDTLCFALGYSVMPNITNDEYIEAVERINAFNIHGVDNMTITAGRPGVLNGFRDFTPYAEEYFGMEKRDKTVNDIMTLHGKSGEAVLKIAQAELDYMHNRTYESLVGVVSTIPVLKEKEDMRLLFVALYLQIRIMLLSGQLTSTHPMIDNLKAELMGVGSEEFIPNVLALEAWTNLYEGKYELVNKWLREDAPDEYNDFFVMDIFAYMIKMRVYLIQEKFLPIIALANRLLPMLEQTKRYQDACEIYMILALTTQAMGNKEEATDYTKKMLILAQKYQYIRLISDEGERVRKLLLSFKDSCGDSEEEIGLCDFIDEIYPLTQKVSILYPRYLKAQLADKPSLTDSENAVLHLLKDGKTNLEIAEQLNVSVNTIKFHTHNIYEKLDVANKGQAITRAVDLGIL